MDATLDKDKVEAIRKSTLKRLCSYILNSDDDMKPEAHADMHWMRSHLAHLNGSQAEIFFDVVNQMVNRAIGSGRQFSSVGFLCRNIHFAETATSAAGIVACWTVGVHKIETWPHEINFIGWRLHVDISKCGTISDVYRVEIT